MQAPGTTSEPGRFRQWWLVAIAVAWAVLLAILAVVSARNDEPTVREQRGIGQAKPVVDQALRELMSAAGADVVVEIAGHTLDEGCRITPIRDGANLTSEVVFYTAESDGPALLERIADQLPERYGVRLRRDADGAPLTLRADAGEFVGVRGTVRAPGVVAFTVSTGCRPLDASAAEVLSVVPSAAAPRALLATWGVAEDDPGRAVAAPCPSGERSITVHGHGADPQPVRAAARTAAGEVVLDTAERFVYRTPEHGVVLEQTDDGLRVSVTIPCAAQPND